MDRLTERDEFGNANIVGIDSADLQLNLMYEDFNRVTDALNKLADYEDAEEQGLLLRLPFKIGQKVYCIYESYIGDLMIGSMVYGYSCLDFPGAYFATKEEAEQAMKETKKCKYVKDNGLCGKNPACTSSGKCEEYCSYFEQALKQMGE